MASRARGMRGARKMGGFTKINVVTSGEQWAETLARAGDKLLIASFSAAWSAPCKAMDPYFVALSKQPEYRNVRFVRVDIDKCSAVALQEGVLAAPSFSAYRSGKKLDSFSGALPQKLVELIETHKGKKKAAGGLSLFLFLAAVAAGGAYVFKVVIPQSQQKEADEKKRREEVARLEAEAFAPKHALPAAPAASSSGADGEEGAGEGGGSDGSGLRGEQRPAAAAADSYEEEPAQAQRASPGKKQAVGPSRGARKQ